MPALAFNADEVFTMAEKIEQNGATFYRAAAARFSDHFALLDQLARMEDVHYRVFSDLHKSISEREGELNAADPDNQMSSFASTLADGYVFKFNEDPQTVLNTAKTIVDVLLFALGREKDSVIFYTWLREMVTRKDGKAQLDTIINEEMSHISWINKELKKQQ